jgi:hypothetical protein
MGLEGFKRNEFEHPLMAGFEDHWRSTPGLEAFFPTQGAQTPAIPSAKAREVEFGPGRRKVVSSGPAKLQKLECEFSTDDMAAGILRAGAAVAIAVEARLRSKAAGLQRQPEHTELRCFGGTL